MPPSFIASCWVVIANGWFFITNNGLGSEAGIFLLADITLNSTTQTAIEYQHPQQHQTGNKVIPPGR